MESIHKEVLKKLYVPSEDSHKGQNGKLLIIGGSHLFHAASLWALEIASKIVDMVFYSSVPENNRIVEDLKKEFRNGIIVKRDDIESYVEEADAVLIGPGMLRAERKIKDVGFKIKDVTLEEINKLEDEGEQSYYLTKYLLAKYPNKKWVIDAGALQMLDPQWLLSLTEQPILTPHQLEFEKVFGKSATEETVSEEAEKYHCILVVKGKEDIVCSAHESMLIAGGNAGMTKGGTGDILAGLIAALATKNDPWLAATAGSFFNKEAGESLFNKVGYYFNASDLANEIPQIMKKHLLV